MMQAAVCRARFAGQKRWRFPALAPWCRELPNRNEALFVRKISPPSIGRRQVPALGPDARTNVAQTIPTRAGFLASAVIVDASVIAARQVPCSAEGCGRDVRASFSALAQHYRSSAPGIFRDA